jgi:hypothetical protein
MSWGDKFVVGDLVKIVDREDQIHIWVTITGAFKKKGDIWFQGKMINNFIKYFPKYDIVDYYSE